MNSQSSAMPESFESRRIEPAMLPATQPFNWSVRRELWEYRSLYVAPLAVAALFLLGFTISLVHLPGKMRAAMALDPMKQHQLIEQPYAFSALLLMGTTFVVALFYCLDTLHGERRDRSILFWKSLPVSDLTTVLAKASIPLIVLPLITFGITVFTQAVMSLLSTAVLLGSGQSLVTFWNHLPLFQMWLMLLYHLVGVHGLWYAPFYGWLLLVSAWARRAPLLWALLPPLVIGFVEKIAFNTAHFASMLLHRFAVSPKGGASTGTMSMENLTPLSLGQFLTSPALWLGLAIMGLCLAAAVRLRRDRGPI